MTVPPVATGVLFVFVGPAQAWVDKPNAIAIAVESNVLFMMNLHEKFTIEVKTAKPRQS